MKLRQALPLYFALLYFCNLFSQSTASKNVTTFTIEAPQLNTHKKIWVYLPENYNDSGSTYPVFYMHDAQNLFDAKTSYVGEWKVDEYLDSITKNEVIVIGIEHGNEKRIEELTPFPNKKYGGGNGDNYLLFIKNTLKPHIDISYRTKPEAKYTTIIGSSLGGLISYYAALKYPNTFGKAGVFSPSFWFSDEIIDFTQNTNLEKHTKLYFLIGSDEGKEVISDMENIISLLIQKGFPKYQIKKEVINGGKHNEAFWSSYFPYAHQWLILD